MKHSRIPRIPETREDPSLLGARILEQGQRLVGMRTNDDLVKVPQGPIQGSNGDTAHVATNGHYRRAEPDGIPQRPPDRVHVGTAPTLDRPPLRRVQRKPAMVRGKGEERPRREPAHVSGSGGPDGPAKRKEEMAREANRVTAFVQKLAQRHVGTRAVQEGPSPPSETRDVGQQAPVARVEQPALLGEDRGQRSGSSTRARTRGTAPRTTCRSSGPRPPTAGAAGRSSGTSARCRPGTPCRSRARSRRANPWWVWACPPSRSSFSNKVTSCCRARSQAAANPEMPDPTTAILNPITPYE